MSRPLGMHSEFLDSSNHFIFDSAQFLLFSRFSMATFNMEEFEEILEKSKDQSQQQKQDQVRCPAACVNSKISC